MSEISTSESALDILISLIENPPEGVDMTIIGGTALAYWVDQYIELYPECFENRIAATQDIDLIVRHTDDAKKCHEAWGGKLQTPDIDHHTPELAILTLGSATETVRIDFLTRVHGLKQNEHIKDRTDLGNGFHLLSEFIVLLNRIQNVISLNRTGENSIDQLKNAVSVVHAGVKARIEAEEYKSACRLMSAVLKLATRSTGRRLYAYHDVDLLSVVETDQKLPGEFLENLDKEISRAKERRVRFLRQLNHRRTSKRTG